MSVLGGSPDNRQWGEGSSLLGFQQSCCEWNPGHWAPARLTCCEARTSQRHCSGAPQCPWGLQGSWFHFQGRRVEDATAEPRTLLLSVPAPFSYRTKSLLCLKMTLLPRCFPLQDISKLLLCAPKHNAFSGCWSFRMETKISE